MTTSIPAPVTTVPAPATSLTTDTAATETASSSATLTSDFDMFLEMLTAQAQYQDPLDPMSSSDYAAQLAQFSMVEQQVFTNEQLTELTTALTGGNVGAMAQWVGMEVRAPAAIAFDGRPVTVVPNPAASADQVSLVVRNENGNEVSRRALPLSAEPVEWDGTDQRGSVLPAGVYSFFVESSVDGEVVLNEPAEVYARVVEAQILSGDIVLQLEGGTFTLADDVTALREPGA